MGEKETIMEYSLSQLEYQIDISYLSLSFIFSYGVIDDEGGNCLHFKVVFVHTWYRSLRSSKSVTQTIQLRNFLVSAQISK